MLRKEHELHARNEGGDAELIRMLIPNNYVSKMIGTKGCMVRELAAKSGGAQIKIISNKEAERQLHDCIVTIAGSLANKQDAACLIIQQLETFRLSAPASQPNNPFVKVQQGALPRPRDRSTDEEIELGKREQPRGKDNDRDHHDRKDPRLSRKNTDNDHDREKDRDRPHRKAHRDLSAESAR